MVFVSIFILLPFQIFSKELSLKECIERSMKESYKIKASEAAVDSARNARNAAFVSFFPSVKTESAYQWLKYKPEPEPMEFDLSALGMSKIEFGELPDKNRNVNITGVMPITPLWSIFNGYKAASLVYDTQKIQQELTKRQIHLEVINLYYNYLLLEETTEMLYKAEKQLRRYKKQAENFYDEGFTDKRAVLKLDIEIAKTEQQLQTVMGNRNILKKNLAVFMNMDVNSFTLKKADVNPVALQTTYSELSDTMNKNRLELKMLENSSAISRRVEKTAFQPLIPTLAFVAGYSRTWDAMQGFQPEGTFFMGGNLSWEVGFDWMKNIFNYKKASGEKIKTRLENIHAKKMMHIELTQLQNDVNTKAGSIDIAHREVKSASENLRIAEDKYEEKLITETELLDAATAYNQAEIKLLSALYEYEISLNKLTLTIGADYSDITKGEN
ncbi:MAG: TolC family protein [bacterium]